MCQISLMGVAEAQYASNQQITTLRSSVLLDRPLEEFEEHQYLARISAIGAAHGTLTYLGFRLSIHEEP